MNSFKAVLVLLAVIGASSAQYALPGQQQTQQWSSVPSEGPSFGLSSAPQALPMNMPVDNAPVTPVGSCSSNSAPVAPSAGAQDSISASSFQGATTAVQRVCTCISVDLPAAPQVPAGPSAAFGDSSISAAAPIDLSAEAPALTSSAQPAQQSYEQQNDNLSSRVRG